MRVVVVTPPEPVVSLDEAKDHLRVEGGDDDAVITGMIAAATAHIDGPSGWLGRAIGVQTLEARIDTFDLGGTVLPYPPVISVTSVKYVDPAGVEQTLAGGYEVLGEQIAPVWGTAWPSIRTTREAVRVRYQAGYSTLPAPIRAAILLMVGDLHRNRGEAVIGIISASVAMSTTVANLLAPYRVYA